jgi:DNA-binding LytR/AlgR family response regulator
MKIVIIEDEKPAARRLSRMLEAHDLQNIQLLHSVEESINWFRENPHPDLLFLDIQLSDGLSFEIFDAVSITAPIIFTTAYDEYALRAFKLNSIDYLLKPIDEAELEAAINKYRTQLAAVAPVQFDFEEIRKLLVNPIDREYKKRFTVRVGQHLKIISVSEIECFYSENKGTYAATQEGRIYLLDQTLEQLENELEPETFFRVSRKFFVNVNYIKDIISYSNSRLKLVLNRFAESEIIVARERVRDFKIWLE